MKASMVFFNKLKVYTAQPAFKATRPVKPNDNVTEWSS